jgi:hypothetical protein
MEYENNMHMIFKSTFTSRLESIASKVPACRQAGRKIIWFRNTCILINFINMMDLGKCEDALTPAF